MRRGMHVIALLVTIFCYSISMGQTTISGPLTESQVWTEDGSPYIVQGEVIATNISLEIEPGTTVLFDPGAYLGTSGSCTFTALGTEVEPILFSSNSASPQPDDYLGFSIGYWTDATMSYCVIEYAHVGLQLFLPIASENVEIRNCVDGLEGLIQYGDVSGFYIHDNTRNGVTCVPDVNITFRNCVINANGSVGILSYAPSWVGADHCTIQDNGSIGMVASGEVTNCNLSSNGGIGLFLDGYGGLPIIAHHNTIVGNSGYGVVIGTASSYSPQINWCSIYGNGEYDMAISESYVYPTVDATHNFWNTQDADVISARILDSNDDPALTSEVIFTPFEGSVATERKTFGEIKSLYR